MIDKRIIVLALLLFLSLSLFLAFAPYGLSEEGYAQLVGKASFLAGFGIGFLKALAVLAAFISSALLFLFISGIGKEYDEKALLPSALSSVLFLLSFYVAGNLSFLNSPAGMFALPFFILAIAMFFSNRARPLAILPFALGLLLAYPYISFSYSFSLFSGFPVVIAFASISLGYYLSQEGSSRRIDGSLICFVLGLLALFVLPSLSLGLFSYSAALSLKRFFSEAGRIPLLMLVFSLLLLLTLATGNAYNSIIVAGSITIVIYLVLSLYYFDVKPLPAYLVLFAISVSFSIIYLNFAMNPVASADQSLVSALEYSAGNNLNPAVLGLPYTYEFYVHKKPIVMNGTDLLSKDVPKFSHIILSSQSLPGSFAQYPVAFGYEYGTKNKDGSPMVVYSGGPYLLLIPLTDDGKIAGDGTLYSASSLEFVRSVPFTKLRQFKKSAGLQDKNSIIFNLDGYEDTQIYGLLLAGEAVFENSGVTILKVS